MITQNLVIRKNLSCFPLFQLHPIKRWFPVRPLQYLCNVRAGKQCFPSEAASFASICAQAACIWLEGYDSENNCHVKSSWASACSCWFNVWQLPRWQASCHQAESEIKQETNSNTRCCFPSRDGAVKVPQFGSHCIKIDSSNYLNSTGCGFIYTKGLLYQQFVLLAEFEGNDTVTLGGCGLLQPQTFR